MGPKVSDLQHHVLKYHPVFGWSFTDMVTAVIFTPYSVGPVTEARPVPLLLTIQVSAHGVAGDVTEKLSCFLVSISGFATRWSLLPVPVASLDQADP